MRVRGERRRAYTPMHFRFFVTFEKGAAKTSHEAREYVLYTLHEECFSYSDGRWGGGMCDWFVIGGRWSGELSRYSWAREITNQMLALEREHDIQVWGTVYADSKQERRQQG